MILLYETSLDKNERKCSDIYLKNSGKKFKVRWNRILEKLSFT